MFFEDLLFFLDPDATNASRRSPGLPTHFAVGGCVEPARRSSSGCSRGHAPWSQHQGLVCTPSPSSRSPCARAGRVGGSKKLGWHILLIFRPPNLLVGWLASPLPALRDWEGGRAICQKLVTASWSGVVWERVPLERLLEDLAHILTRTRHTVW